MSFYDPVNPTGLQQGASSPIDVLLAETLGTGPNPWRRVETTLMATAATMRDAYDNSFAPHDLNLTQASMLVYIIEFGPATQSKIADHLGHGRATTGATVDILERRGFVERLADPNDRRVKLVQVTSEGLELSEKLREIDMHLSTVLRNGITRSERRALASVLNRLQANLLETMQETRP